MAITKVTRQLLSTGIDDNSNATAITIDSSENVGVGTASPSTYDSRANNLVVGDSGDSGITIFSGASSDARLQFAPSGSTGLDNGLISYDNNNDSMVFATGGSDRLHIDSSGNVGIGTSSISSWTKLQVQGTAGAQTGAKQALYITSPTTTANEGVGIRMSAASGSNEAVGIIGMVNNASGNSGSMTFHTYAGGADIPERARITSGGHLLIGKTSSGIDVTGFTFDSNGNSNMVCNLTSENESIIYNNNNNSGAKYIHDFRQNGTSVGKIEVGTSSTGYVVNSDYRLKENVDYSFDATSRLKQLKPCRFNWIVDDTNTLIDGFLAHEVSSIVPEAISGDKDAVDSDNKPKYQGIDHSKLVPLLVKAIQEQQTIIDDLKSRIKTLEDA
jgi:hypothetical protein